MLFLFAPLVGLLVSGASKLTVPFEILLYSVIAFIVFPCALGTATRTWFVRRHGQGWFENILLPRFAPMTVVALLTTLVLIFAFQAENITGKAFHVFLIAVPILLQVYFNSSFAYGLMKLLKVPYAVAAPRRADRGQQFLRAACGNRDRSVRSWIWSGADNGRRGPGRSASDALGLCRLQSNETVVPYFRGERDSKDNGLSGGSRQRADPRDAAEATDARDPMDTMTKKRVLFLCTGNSSRSQMAEGLLRHLAGDRFEVFSAGTQPVGLNPLAVAVMREQGINISRHRSKGMNEFAGQQFDYVITVCDQARESCPVPPPSTKRLHWSFEDPAAAKGPAEVREAIFRRVRDEIAARIRQFIQEEG